MLVPSFVFTNEEQKKISSRRILLPPGRTPVLFLTSLIQADGHAMAALTAMFWQLSNVDLKTTTSFNKQDADRASNCRVFFFIFYFYIYIFLFRSFFLSFKKIK